MGISVVLPELVEEREEEKEEEEETAAKYLQEEIELKRHN
jgi:hypothetical protein